MNELANVNNAIAIDGTDFIGNLTSRTTMFCSLKAETAEQKAAFFNAMNNPEKRLSDCINSIINAKDLFVEVVTLTKKDATGADVLDDDGNPITNDCPRIVVIDENGVGYGCVSMGVYSAFRKIIAVYGTPTWESPIPLEVKQITKGQRKMLTLNVAPPSKMKK